MTLEFRVLGDVSIRRDGVALELGGRRPRALVALLIVNRGRPILVDTIVDRLWPDEAPDSAVKTVQVYVSRIRAALGPERDRLVSRSGSYELVADAGAVDAAAFADEVAAARTAMAGGSVPDAIASVERAFEHWRGRPFGDLADEPFLRAEAQRLEDLRMTAEELRAEALTASGRAPDAVGSLRALVADEPTRETAWSRLLLALYAAGRQAEALGAFHDARRILDEQLGIEPGPELQAAHLAVLQQSAPIPAPPFERPSDSALGRRPELVGRAADLERIAAAVARGARIVTLTGPGGIGKTSLAREVLARWREQTASHVVLVELEAIRDADLVPGSVAAALGGDGDASAQIGDQAALLGLDNFEQVLAASSWVSEIVAACPRLQVLVTSREPLRIEGETIHPVEPLGAEASSALFLRRARLVRPDLAPSPEIDGVCERLDRLPLAIELAAARTSLLSPGALLSRLDRALDILGETGRDHVDRQRTLRSTIAWSYALLEPDLQRVFRRLAVFVGGFGVDAAETVAGATLDDLDKLLAGSLIVGRYDTPEPRFALLETIRAFALEQLEAALPDGSELADIRRAHMEWSEASIEAARNVSDPGLATRRLVLDLDNFRAAIAWAAGNGHDVSRWRIVVGLSEVWQTRGHLAEARRLLETGLDEARIPDDLRAEALDDASTVALRQGRLEDAERLASQELALARALDQPRRSVLALAKLAQSALGAGDAERARDLHREARSVAAADADRRPLLVSLTGQAQADLLEGRATLAAETFEECLVIAREVGRPESVATAVFNVGLARLIEGHRLDAARDALRESLDRYEALDDVEGIGYVLVAAARSLAATDPRGAVEALGASSAALGAADAELEAVESGMRDTLVSELRSTLGRQEFDASFASGADRRAEDRIRIARAALTR